MSDFGPMAPLTSKPHSSAVEYDFLNGYEGAPAVRGNKVSRYGKDVTLSGAAHRPQMVHTGDEFRVDSFSLRGKRDDLLVDEPGRSATVRPMGSPVRGRRGLKIRRRYGRAALEIVDGCTDSRSKPKPPFRKRKESYVAKLLESDDLGIPRGILHGVMQKGGDVVASSGMRVTPIAPLISNPPSAVAATRAAVMGDLSCSGEATPTQIVVAFSPLSRPRRTPLHLTYTSFSAPGGALCKAYAHRSNQESGAL